MLTNKNKSDLHYVSVFAVGQIKDDDTHYFEAFFRNKIDADRYVKQTSSFLNVFDISYQIPKDVYLKDGDFFTLPCNKGVKYASEI